MSGVSQNLGQIMINEEMVKFRRLGLGVGVRVTVRLAPAASQ